MNLQSKIVRAEIAEVLKSGRLVRLVSVSAQLFRLIDSSWKELTFSPILVHLFHDALEDVTKMLAVYECRVVINNTPVSANFNMLCPSKKFIHFVCNKFDKNSEVYGFGFTDACEMELFHTHLSRIRSSAMASLTPSFHINSSASAPNTPRATCRVIFPQRSNFGASGLITPAPPCGYLSSPGRPCLIKTDSNSSLNAFTPALCGPTDRYRQGLNSPNSSSLLIPLGRRSLSTDLPREDLEDKTLGDIPVQEDYLSSLLSNGLYEESTLNPMLTPNQADIQMQSTDTADHIHDRNSLGFPVSHSDDFGNGNKEDTYSLTERRVRELIASFEPLCESMPLHTIFSHQQAEISVSNQVSPAPFGMHHGNPAGVIGTPVKGRGGVAKSEDEGEKWKW